MSYAKFKTAFRIVYTFHSLEKKKKKDYEIFMQTSIIKLKL